MKNIIYAVSLFVTLALPFNCALANNDAVEAARRPKTVTDANIAGHVLDQDGKHIPHVSIAIRENNIGIVSDATGHFFIKNMPIGEFTLVASYLGYKPFETKVKTIKGKTIELNITLQQDITELDEIVVSANRTEVKRRESATIVNVFNTKMFEKTSSNNVSEALSFQTGMRVEQSCSNCGVPQLRINGLEGQYSQILLDSRPIFSSLSTVYGLEQLPAAMIERVEVIRGGGSALFGANAIAGVVNIITKEPVSNSFTLSNRTGLMGGKKLDQNTMLNGSLVSDDHRSGAYIFAMIRDREAYDRDGDSFSEVPQLDSETIGFRAYHKVTDFSRLTAEYHHIREFRRGGNKLDLQPHQADIAEQLRHQINGGGLKYDLYSKDYSRQLNIFGSVQGINRDSYFGTHQNQNAYGATTDLTVVGGAQGVFNIKKLIFMPSQLVFGIEGNYNKLDDVIKGYNRDTHQKTHTIGGYAQNEWKTDKLSLLIGGRLEKHNLMDNLIFSPRANIRYAPVKQLVFRGSYAYGYRAPQAYDEDLHVSAVGGEVALIRLAEGLRPEYSNSFSGSAEWTKRVSWGQYSLLMEGFYTKLDDQFSLVEKGKNEQGNMILERTNARGATVKGVNTELRVDNMKYFSFQAGATYQRSRYKEPFAWSTEDGVAPVKNLFRTPDLYGYATLTANMTKRLSLASTLNYTGPMYVQHLEKLTVTHTRSFTEWGAKANYKFNLSRLLVMDLEVGCKNIFDEFQPDIDKGADRDAKYIYGPAMPRTIYFGVKIAM